MTEATRAALLQLRAQSQARITELERDLQSLFEASRSSNADDEHDPEGPTIAVKLAPMNSELDGGATVTWYSRVPCPAGTRSSARIPSASLSPVASKIAETTPLEPSAMRVVKRHCALATGISAPLELIPVTR